MADLPEQQLPKAVADKYELKHLGVGTYDIPGLGIIDLSDIDLKTAAKVAKKTPYLVPKEAVVSAKAKTTASKT